MTQIITGAPVWVWPLLAVLVLLGMRALQQRWVPVALVYMLPLLGVLTLRTTASLPAGGWIWIVFVVAYGLGVWAGYVLQRKWLLGHEGGKVQLAGESLTLVVMMVVFWANFAGGILQAVAPAVYGGAVFQLLFAALLAACGGSFAGRALRVWRGVA